MAKADLSGVWELTDDSLKYLQDLAADFKPSEFPIRGWADTLTKERLAGAHASDFPANVFAPMDPDT
jgi:hypothetical protein